MPFWFNANAQDKTISGIVYDKASKFRLGKVYLYSINSKNGVYNNSKGEFTINVKRGDYLVASLQGYKADTLLIKDQKILTILLQKTSINLQQVEVKDSVKSARQKYEESRQQFKRIYRIGSTEDLLITGGGNGQGGAGIGIDALYNALSRSGRNARKLQETFERDYRNNFIDQRFNESLVKKITGLSGSRLKEFMFTNRPDYNFIVLADDYELIKFIKIKYDRFKNMPGIYYLPDLKPIPINN